MDERGKAMAGGAAGLGVDTETRRRPEFGIVFCELPPRDGPGGGPGPSAQPRTGPHATGGDESADGSDGGPPRRTPMGGAGDTVPYVSAAAARAHLAALARAGVGLKTVARLSGVSHGSLSQIVYGQPRQGRPPSRRIRPQTLRSILAVTTTQARGGQRVDAAPTWTLVDELVAAGYSRRFLARALGSEAASPRLQLGKTLVRASTARAVEDLHRRLLKRPRPRG